MLEPLEPSVMATMAHWEASSMPAAATEMLSSSKSACASPLHNHAEVSTGVMLG